MFTEVITDKFDFVNACACFVQALTALVASIDLKYNKNFNISEEKKKALYDFQIKNGILFQVESMLSCSSNEHLMIYDHYNALQTLNFVHIHLPQNFVDIEKIDTFYTNLEING